MKTIYRLKISFCLLWASIIVNPASAQWESAGTNISSSLDFQNTLTTDKHGNFYLAFQDAAYSQRATVKKLVSGSWVTLGDPGFAGGQGGQACSMALTPDGVPFVAVIGPPNLDASVWTLAGNVWVKLGGDISEEMAFGVELALDSDHVPYVLYRDQKNINGIQGRATVKKFNGLSWEVVGSPGFSDDFIQSLDIAMDSDDVPYVAYEDGANSLRGTVKKFDGSAWVTVGTTGFTNGWAKAISLTLDQDDVPYLAFENNSLNSWIKCMKFDGTSWVSVGLATGVSGVSASYPSLRIDKYNVPYIAYKSDERPFSISMKSFNGTSWQLIGAADFTGNTAAFTSIAFDINANPYVAFQDANNGFRASVFGNSVRSPLPVRLVSFSGKFVKPERSVALTWETSLEYNHDKFEVEAGFFPTGFRKIGEVKGSGNSSTIRIYSFSDTVLNADMKYYRLKQLDLDGTYSYSKIVSVKIPLDDRFYIKNNPVPDDMLVVKSAKDSPEQVRFSLFSVSGKKLKEWESQEKKEYRLGLQNIAPGTYLLQYADKTGVRTRKFIKY